ncbi:3D (Asp-Asp-Asp) domain-containing protein [Hydrogenispora ethanolica]|uniref:3D (Asp-Asp-Asp) domain-containing protein n=1 Tax=Hydrogenispora ethanolica TaxID=1082276 RepID=A0A4R1R486_HYDET|nr:3D (Asp-Asp-Asp) domain-containing protein [Hydrogenispora ethanolica]
MSLSSLLLVGLPKSRIQLKVDGVESSWRPTMGNPGNQWLLEQPAESANPVPFQRVANSISAFPFHLRFNHLLIQSFPVNQSFQSFRFHTNQNVQGTTPLLDLSPLVNPEQGIAMLEINYLPVKIFQSAPHIAGSILQVYRLKLADHLLHSREWVLVVRYFPKTNEAKIVKILPISRLLITGRGNFLYRYAKIMEATAYYPGPECTGKYSTGFTFTGKKATRGIVAVDPRVIALGTMLYIEGYGHAEAADIGGAIRGNRIDLCFVTYREAKNYGRKNVKVYILE